MLRRRGLVLICLGLVLLMVLSLNGFAQEKKWLLPPEKADVNWTAYKGTTLTIGLNKHPYTESLRPLISQFEELTGIEVAYVILPEEEFFEKLLIDLSSGAGLFDIYMTSPMFEWRYQYAGWVEDLLPYYNNPKLTDKEWYNREDFFPLVLRANEWDGTIGGGMGEGRWNGIPVMVEFFVQAYREDLRKKWGLIVPKDYPEWYDVVTKADEQGGPDFFGIVERGIRSWSTVHSGYYTGFNSWGQKELTKDLYASIDTPEAIEFTKIWVKALQDAGVPGWPTYTWYDGMESYAAGRIYMYNDCDFFAATYENPAKSTIAGKSGYALPPAGPDGRIASNLWTWALGMSALSRHKEAAWLFLQWATSYHSMIDATVKHDNFNPTRKSIWEHPDVANMVKNWGAYPGQYAENVNLMLTKYGDIRWTPNPDVTAVGDIWCDALHEAYARQKTVEQALKDSTRGINRVMRKWRIALGIEK